MIAKFVSFMGLTSTSSVSAASNDARELNRSPRVQRDLLLPLDSREGYMDSQANHLAHAVSPA
jgi:hypothetical protein